MPAQAASEGARSKFSTWWARIAWWLWVALLLTIPITSHPWVARLTGKTGVSPLSGIPLLLLMVGWLPWYILRRRTLPAVVLLLLAFCLAALAASAAAFFLPILPAGDQTVLGREVRALLTLALGAGYFLIAATLPATREQVTASLRWIYGGAMLLLAYSAFQAARLPLAFNPIPEPVVAFHRLFSIRDPLRARVTGFAFEPSWLGDQLVMLYLPLLLASVWVAFSAFSRRSRRISMELLLLIGSIGILFFTFARLAWLSFLLMMGTLIVATLWRRISQRMNLAGQTGRRLQSARLGVAGAVVLLMLTLAAGLVVVGASLDTRFAALLSADLETAFSGRHPWPYALANQLKYGERLMYWIAGFRIFSRFPILGVGLGNSGFLLADTVPGFAFTLPEAIDTLRLGAYGLPNTKSLWIRLLAETGMVGFGLFAAFAAAIGLLGGRLMRQSEPLTRIIGLAALLAIGALLVEGFSLDSFALPQLWIVPGLAAAMARIGRAQGTLP